MGKCYKRNFVKQVVARIDFMVPVDLFSKPEIISGLDEIRKRFPIAEQGTGSQQTFQVGPEGVQTSKTDFPEWIFNGPDRKKTLKLNKLFLEVVLNSYSSESDLKADLIVPASQILKANPGLLVQRTGVRFVNVFDFPQLNIENANDYFSDSISANLRPPFNRTGLSRVLQINEYTFDDLKARLQTGFFNPDYPAKIQRSHFVIDVDSYIDFPHQINDTEQHFSKLHSKIEELFEESIKDKLRNEVLDV